MGPGTRLMMLRLVYLRSLAKLVFTSLNFKKVSSFDLLNGMEIYFKR
jgi:hypothetical protein